jgi:aspartyl protease family protein
VTDKGADAIYYGLWLVLIASALMARRIPFKSTIKMALGWVAIFAVGLLLVGARDHYTAIWTGASDLLYGNDQIVSGDSVAIRMAEDGHFWANVELNGVRRRMLIDSGATTTAISLDTAKAAGLDLDQSPFPTILNTANGSVTARVSTINRLKLGAIEARDLPVVVSRSFGDLDVIGMNFLSRLKAWRVEGRTLVLQPNTKSDLT